MSDNTVCVLVVDDDPAMLDIYTRLFSRAGYRCLTARSGGEALTHVAQEDIDVVLTDLNMEGMGGIELMHRLRAIDPDLPILVATGAPGIDSALQSIDAGVFRYLQKPLSHSEVVRTTGDAVHARALARARRAAFDYVGVEKRVAITPKDLLRAVDTMWLAVQPIVSVTRQRVIAYEALLRTRDPVLRDPLSLLAAAEKLELHSAVGRAVRRHAAELVPSLPDGVDLFVNLHPCDLLDPELFSRSAAMSMHASRIVLEMTERASLDCVPDARARVAELKQLGYRIAIDDMGAGYAGLTSFAILRPSYVKIDLSLVRDVDSDPMKQTLIRSIVDLAKALEMSVIGECVETTSEARMLTSLGCDLLQGYLFARPAAPFPELTW